MNPSTLPHTASRGFTLVELIVSVALFSVVMLIAGAAFLTLIDLDRRARATNDVVTNLSYVTDAMARSIRTGTDYNCGGGDCPTGRDSFSFVDADGRNVSYARSGTSVRQCIGSNCMAITDPRVQVQRLDFYVRGTSATDSRQPTVIFTLRGTITPAPNAQTVEFVIESAATQRLIDL